MKLDGDAGGSGAQGTFGLAFPPQFLDEIRTRIPVSDIVARKVKLERRGREFVGLSPFNPEKTPSFTVNDQKGFYHCFSSGEHGDVFAWLMRTEGLSFPEAVERLAGEAGLEMPRQSPAERAREERRKTLYDAVDAACHWFEAQLHARAGREALAYLRERGLSDATITAFRLGYAPEGMGLKAALSDQGIGEDLLLEAGLLRRRDGSQESYSFFRNRVMFPITDRRGRVLAFGGRFMGDHKQAQTGKYINSPETPLFDKGRTLYNFDRARGAVHDDQVLLVTEGYMDVIGLAQAGFRAAVAPLGTAITEYQMQVLWQLAPEPVLCLDGDDAGRRAAARAADRALAVLKPGRSLQFAFLPQGEDPDSLVRGAGPAAMHRVIEDARPLAEIVWRIEAAARPIDTPERRADLERRLQQRVASIADQTVREHYRRVFKDRLWKTFAAKNQRRSWGRSTGRRRDREEPVDPTVDRSLKNQASSLQRRQHVIVLTTLINHPLLLDEFGTQMDGLEFDPDLDKVRQGLQNLVSTGEYLDAEAIRAHFSDAEGGRVPVGILDRLTYKMAPFSNPEADIADARAGLESIFHLQTQGRLRAEVEEMKRNASGEMASDAMERWRATRETIEAGERQIAEAEDIGND